MKDLANLEKFDKRNVFLEKMIKIINKDRKLKNNMFLKCLGKHRTKPNSGKVKLNYRIKEWDIDIYYFTNARIKRNKMDRFIIAIFYLSLLFQFNIIIIRLKTARSLLQMILLFQHTFIIKSIYLTIDSLYTCHNIAIPIVSKIILQIIYLDIFLIPTK